MKLYVDDIRPAPDETWAVARTVSEAKRYLETGEVISVSLDHDMGACDVCVKAGTHIGKDYVNHCPHAEDGYALVMWMIDHGRVPAFVAVHSMNPVGRRRMIAALESRQRSWTPEKVEP